MSYFMEFFHVLKSILLAIWFWFSTKNSTQIIYTRFCCCKNEWFCKDSKSKYILPNGNQWLLFFPSLRSRASCCFFVFASAAHMMWCAFATNAHAALHSLLSRLVVWISTRLWLFGGAREKPAALARTLRLFHISAGPRRFIADHKNIKCRSVSVLAVRKNQRLRLQSPLATLNLCSSSNVLFGKWVAGLFITVYFSNNLHPK